MCFHPYSQAHHSLGKETGIKQSPVIQHAQAPPIGGFGQNAMGKRSDSLLRIREEVRKIAEER